MTRNISFIFLLFKLPSNEAFRYFLAQIFSNDYYGNDDSYKTFIRLYKVSSPSSGGKKGYINDQIFQILVSDHLKPPSQYIIRKGHMYILEKSLSDMPWSLTSNNSFVNSVLSFLKKH